MDNKFVTAIIVAAGNSTRMGGNISKQFISIKEDSAQDTHDTAYDVPQLSDIIVQ